ncbi:MAG: APC family permease [Actinomycetota bacterium]
MSSETTAAKLGREKIGLAGVLIPGLAMVAPAFNLFFSTGLIASLAGAAVPLMFLIAMVAVAATASSLAQFAAVYPSSGSFLTYIAKTIGAKSSTTIGVIAILGYVISFGGIYIFVGSYIVSNLFASSHIWGITQIVTILYGVLVTAPVIVGLKFGVRLSYVLYVFEALLLIVMSIVFLAHGGPQGITSAPFKWPGGSKSTLLALGWAIWSFGGFEAAAPLAEETRDPRKNVPRALLLTVLVSGTIYVLGSWALVTAFGPSHVAALIADPNPFHTAAATYASAFAPLIVWIFLTSVTSSYVAANTQVARVIFGGARSGLWSRRLAKVSEKFQTPARAAVAFVAPSIVIGVASTWFTNPGLAVGFLTTLGILGIITMYLAVNVALVVHWYKNDRKAGARRFVMRLVVPIIAFLILIVPVYGALQPGQQPPYKYLPFVTIGLVLAGVIYTAVLASRKPEVIRDAPGLLEGAEL